MLVPNPNFAPKRDSSIQGWLAYGSRRRGADGRPRVLDERARQPSAASRARAACRGFPLAKMSLSSLRLCFVDRICSRRNADGLRNPTGLGRA